MLVFSLHLSNAISRHLVTTWRTIQKCLLCHCAKQSVVSCSCLPRSFWRKCGFAGYVAPMKCVLHYPLHQNDNNGCHVACAALCRPSMHLNSLMRLCAGRVEAQNSIRACTPRKKNVPEPEADELPPVFIHIASRILCRCLHLLLHPRQVPTIANIAARTTID